MLGRREYGWQLAVATGVALGLGQLVRAFSLWTLAAVVLAFAVARAWRPLVVIVLAAAVVTAPWYVRQAVKYGDPVFDRPTKNQAIWDRRPARFYVGLGLPDVVTDPIRPHFVNEAIPTTYSEVWGDYFGVWRGSRERQSILGLLPTRARDRRLAACCSFAPGGCPPGSRSRCCRALGSSAISTSPSAIRRRTGTC